MRGSRPTSLLGSQEQPHDAQIANPEPFRNEPACLPLVDKKLSGQRRANISIKPAETACAVTEDTLPIACQETAHVCKCKSQNSEGAKGRVGDGEGREEGRIESRSLGFEN